MQRVLMKIAPFRRTELSALMINSVWISFVIAEIITTIISVILFKNINENVIENI